MTTQLKYKTPKNSSDWLQPTLTLLIPVYKGGAYWQECWQSVTPLAHKFDRILVSFNYSELQRQDLQVVEADKLKNLQILVQSQLLSFTDHIVSIVQQVETDYIFFLCADDWLLKDGVEEARELLQKNLDNTISIVGAHEWGETFSSYQGITRNLCNFTEGMKVADYLLTNFDRCLPLQLSGLIVSTTSLQQCKSMMELFSSLGWMLDDFIATHPGVEIMFSTFHPLIRGRIHPEQLGKQVSLLKASRVTDTINYYMFHAFQSSDQALISCSVDKIHQLWIELKLVPDFIYVSFYILKLLIISLSWRQCQGRFRTVSCLLSYLPHLFDKFFTKLNKFKIG